MDTHEPAASHQQQNGQLQDHFGTHSIEHLSEQSYGTDPLLTNLFPNDLSLSNVAPQYIDASLLSSFSEEMPNLDLSYSYDDSMINDSPIESPLSANVSFLSDNQNTSFYQQTNDSYVQRMAEVCTTNTPLERVSHSWAPTSLASINSSNSSHTQFRMEERFKEPYATPLTTSVQPATPFVTTQQEQYVTVNPNATQQYHTLGAIDHQQLPTPDEPNALTSTYFPEPPSETMVTVDMIPAENVRRLERYLERVKDVHQDDVEEQNDRGEDQEGEGRANEDISPIGTTHIDANAVDGAPLQGNTLIKGRGGYSEKKRPSLKSVSSSGSIRKPNGKNMRGERVELRDFTAENVYRPLVKALQADTVLWTKVKCTKKKGIYKCSHCPGIFASLLDLAKHLDEFKIVRPYRCPFSDCPWSVLGLPRRAEVRRHCAAQHSHVIPNGDDGYPGTGKYTPTTADQFDCTSPFCDKKFKRKDACKRHYKLVHSNPDSRFNKMVERIKKKYRTEETVALKELILHHQQSSNNNRSRRNSSSPVNSHSP